MLTCFVILSHPSIHRASTTLDCFARLLAIVESNRHNNHGEEWLHLFRPTSHFKPLTSNSFPCHTSLPRAERGAHGPLANPSLCHTCENFTCNSFPCHTSKNIGFKVLCLPHIQKLAGVGVLLLTKFLAREFLLSLPAQEGDRRESKDHSPFPASAYPGTRVLICDSTPRNMVVANMGEDIPGDKTGETTDATAGEFHNGPTMGKNNHFGAVMLWHLKRARLRALSLSVIVLTAAGLASARQSDRASLPDAPAAKQSDTPKKQQTQSGRLKTTLEIMGSRSAFFPELATDRGPLNAHRKLELALDETIAPSRSLGSAFTSGISQARDGLPGYGQEWGGYGKRFGSSMASNATSHMIGTFLLPAILHQDPRYFVKLHGSFGTRVGYALRSLVAARTDSGGKAFNWSGVLGSLVAEGLANSYLPDEERTAGKTFSRFGIRMGFSAVGYVAKEYWPTIFKGLRISRLVPNEQSDPGTVRPSAPSRPPPQPPQ
jgi:hypothetical protein